MGMKKVIMLSAIMAAMASANAFANPATVNFNGNVTATSCTLVASSEAIDLIIPDVTTKQLADAGNNLPLAESPESTIQLVSCPASVTSVNMSSTTTTGTPKAGAEYLITPESGAATGIYVKTQVKDDAGAWSSLNAMTLNPVTWVPAGDGTVNIGTKSGVVSDTLATTYTPGDYNTTWTLTFSWA